ncbi:tetratricopeptide repeat protein [Streptomyces sp. NPDC049906]|uniref:ATP-binding protein n=1 Tax=Streptomyces sp. NPDC049906 TaxID=3155656 RepID=UPI003422F325
MGVPEERAQDDGTVRGPGSSHADFSGSARGVVQARSVHGGVHFHRSAPNAEPAPQQLPGDVRGFTNRVVDLAHLEELLEGEGGEGSGSVNVAVIAGTAGVGKTSLAVHWSHRIRDRFPDGQLYVNLRGYDPGPPVGPEQALDRFLRALDVPPTRIPADLEDKAALYRSRLAGRRYLVLLDNASAVSQVRPLLPGTAGCLVVVTSRHRMSGLVARDGARRVTIGTLNEPEAVALLRRATRGYRHDDDPAELVELARLCAYLPLALRIAAERAASRPRMPLRELIRDLRDESALWDALTAEEGEESDAVRTVFAWSYRALPGDAARLFRLLGMHPGPDFGVPQAAALTGAGPVVTRHLLDALTGAHLLEQTVPARYQFHDLLRAYAVDQVNQEETGEDRTAVLRRLLTWYLHTADAAARHESGLHRVELGPPEAGVVPSSFRDGHEAVGWLTAEQANLTAAVRAAADAGFDRIAWQLHVVLRAFYSHQNLFAEWHTTGALALAAARRQGDRRGEAEVHHSLGMAYTQSQQLDRAAVHHAAALAGRRETGDRWGELMSLNGIGLLELRRRRLDVARAAFEESLAVAEELGDRHWRAVVLSNLGETDGEREEFERAHALLTEALEVFRELGAEGNEGNALRCLSVAQRGLGRTGDALRSAGRAVALAQEHGNPMWEGYWLLELGRVRLAGDRPEEALTAYQQAAAQQRRLGDRSREARALDGAGEAYQRLGRPADAVDFHRRAAAVHRELGDLWRWSRATASLADAVEAAADEGDGTEGAREAARLRREVLAVPPQPGDRAAARLHERLRAARGTG